MRGVLVVSVARSPNAKVSAGIFFINGEGIERLGGGFWAGHGRAQTPAGPHRQVAWEIKLGARGRAAELI